MSDGPGVAGRGWTSPGDLAPKVKVGCSPGIRNSGVSFLNLNEQLMDVTVTWEGAKEPPCLPFLSFGNGHSQQPVLSLFQGFETNSPVKFLESFSLKNEVFASISCFQ